MRSLHGNSQTKGRGPCKLFHRASCQSWHCLQASSAGDKKWPADPAIAGRRRECSFRATAAEAQLALFTSSCEAFQCLVLSGFSLCLSNQWSGRGGIKRPCKKGQVLSGKPLVDVPASIAPNCPQPGPNQLHVAKAHPDVCCKRSSPCGACMGTARPKAAASAICFTEHLACWHVRSHSQDLSSEA